MIRRCSWIKGLGLIFEKLQLAITGLINTRVKNQQPRIALKCGPCSFMSYRKLNIEHADSESSVCMFDINWDHSAVSEINLLMKLGLLNFAI